MLELLDIRKSFEGQPLLQGVSFTVGREETLCLLGPSGSGKSTLLQLIAGLDTPEAGRVLWNGQDLAAIPPHLRDFGLVFQDYALFPHLDVFGNVAFGPRMKGMSRAEAARRVSEVLQLVDLAGFERRSVAELSGGEQQRVALARALAPRPRLLMFDEPLGALDRALRDGLINELREVLSRAGIPALYVTHDQEEAFKIGDRLALLHAGRIVRQGTPSDVWAHPGSAWAAVFLGLGNVLPGQVASGGRRVKTAHGSFQLGCPHRHRPGDAVHVLLRPRAASRGVLLRGTVADVAFTSEGYRVLLTNGLFFDASKSLRKGSRITFRLQMECLSQDSPERSEAAGPRR